MIDPKTPEDCLQLIRCRITDEECQITCKLIDILLLTARYEGKCEGIEEMTEKAIRLINKEDTSAKGRLN